MPDRIQRKRTRGWRMPPDAVYVGRPTKWGNPFCIGAERSHAESVIAFRTWLSVDGCHADMPDRKTALLESLHELRGRDLACWCPLDRPCHADVLLELANA